MKFRNAVSMLSATCALMSGWGSTAEAVPLLGETSGTIREGILTLYRDHEKSNRVYFFPNASAISRTQAGLPQFHLAHWDKELDGKGGGYLTATLKPSSDADQKRALDSFMAANPGIEVAVVPVKSSIIGISSTLPGSDPLSALFTEFNFARSGGRAEDEIGINALMTNVGARVMSQMLQNQTTQLMKVDYCYKVQGYGPAFDAKVTVQMDRVYDYFSASASTGGWFWRASIRSVTEKLIDQRDIVIERYGGDASDDEMLNKIAEAITARLFTPELAASPVQAAHSNAFYSFGASHVHRRELKRETWTWKSRDLEEREFCIPISLKDLEGYADKIVTKVH